MLNPEILTAHLNSNECNITETANQLGISRQMLHYFIAKFKIIVEKKAKITVDKSQ